MRLFDRALLVVYAFLLTCFFVLFSLGSLGWSVPRNLLNNLFYLSRPEYFWALMAVLVLVGLRLIWVGLSRPAGSGSYVVLAEGAAGQVRVSIHAIENLVVKIVTGLEGVREVKPRVVSLAQGVGIRIRTVVTPDINIPATAEKIQTMVQEEVLAVTGIAVSGVKVSITNIEAKKPRVE